MNLELGLAKPEGQNPFHALARTSDLSRLKCFLVKVATWAEPPVRTLAYSVWPGTARALPLLFASVGLGVGWLGSAAPVVRRASLRRS